MEFEFIWVLLLVAFVLWQLWEAVGGVNDEL